MVKISTVNAWNLSEFGVIVKDDGITVDKIYCKVC